jgi:hypothetical protein
VDDSHCCTVGHPLGAVLEPLVNEKTALRGEGFLLVQSLPNSMAVVVFERLKIAHLSNEMNE